MKKYLFTFDKKTGDDPIEFLLDTFVKGGASNIERPVMSSLIISSPDSLTYGHWRQHIWDENVLDKCFYSFCEIMHGVDGWHLHSEPNISLDHAKFAEKVRQKISDRNSTMNQK